ncbi:hypothetical protein STRIP9103_06700 [Streptomyces ipomoeae 91-03]|uniref:Uncharacterized protein n=1 Tax=Streptomyces ipomoeae 91-03 TaxID=698759 RepID=L1KIK9_9ACTN|nr:hypothetical protein STRIP9103_06700 [Streptomyces ipomoeae 91-03]
MTDGACSAVEVLSTAPKVKHPFRFTPPSTPPYAPVCDPHHSRPDPQQPDRLTERLS